MTAILHSNDFLTYYIVVAFGLVLFCLVQINLAAKHILEAGTLLKQDFKQIVDSPCIVGMAITSSICVVASHILSAGQ